MPRHTPKRRPGTEKAAFSHPLLSAGQPRSGPRPPLCALRGCCGPCLPARPHRGWTARGSPAFSGGRAGPPHPPEKAGIKRRAACPAALFITDKKSKAHPAVCAKPKPTALAGGCPAMGFMLPSSAKAGGLQFTHGRRAPDSWLVGFNVGATNRTGQAYAAFRRGAGPRGVTARYRTAPPGARQTPRSPRPALHRPLRYPKTPRRFLRPRA